MTNCPPDCAACRDYPIEPQPSILEGAVAGFGIAAGTWLGVWIIYSLAHWVVQAGAGTASLVWVVTVGALGGVFAVTTGRR